MTDKLEARHFICNDCHIRLFRLSRAKKHEKKTQHTTSVNQRAENAHRVYRERLAYAKSYSGRLDAKVAEGGAAWL